MCTSVGSFALLTGAFSLRWFEWLHVLNIPQKFLGEVYDHVVAGELAREILEKGQAKNMYRPSRQLFRMRTAKARPATPITMNPRPVQSLASTNSDISNAASKAKTKSATDE